MVTVELGALLQALVLLSNIRRGRKYLTMINTRQLTLDKKSFITMLFVETILIGFIFTEI
jgi:hypothetical protein